MKKYILLKRLNQWKGDYEDWRIRFKCLVCGYKTEEFRAGPWESDAIEEIDEHIRLAHKK